jgi:hypothetical protein
MITPLADLALADVDFQATATRSGRPALTLAVPAARILVEGPTSHACAHLPVSFRAIAEFARAAAGQERPPALYDAQDHQRDVYYPLAVHLLLAAFRRCYESLPGEGWNACEQSAATLVQPLRAIEPWADTPPPPDRVAFALWCALGLSQQGQLAGRDVDVDLADAVVQQVLGPADLDAPLHPRRPDESLDAWTWRELTGLHAVANLALLRRNQAWAGRVEQVALYHQENTQPDNVTAHPWALFAFLWSPHTRPQAEQQLHDVSTALAASTSWRPAGERSVLAGLLLADAAASLAAFGGVRLAS